MIGASSKNAKLQDKWIEEVAEPGFKLIELNHRATPFYFYDKLIKEVKHRIRKNKVKVTIHSGVTDLLHKDKIINTAQINILKSEIKYASIMSIKHVTFHLPKYLDHKKDNPQGRTQWAPAVRRSPCERF